MRGRSLVLGGAQDAAAGGMRSLRPQSLRWLAALLAIVVVAIIAPPFPVSILNQVLGVGIAAIGFNVLFGNSGQISMGAAAFLGTGAFMTAGLTGAGIPAPVAIVVASIAALVLGVVIGVPSLRLSSHYLVFSTLALHFIVLFGLTQVQGASPGFAAPQSHLILLPFGADARLTSWALVYGVLLVAVGWGMENLLRGRAGRAWLAIKEHPSAAAVAGIDVVFWRLAPFGISAFLFGLVGSLQYFYLGHVSVDDFSLAVVVSFLAVVLVGGLGSILGSLVGSLTVVVVPYIVSAGTSAFGSDPLWQRLQFAGVGMIYGLLLIFVVLFEPGGIAAGLGRIARLWRRGVARSTSKPASVVIEAPPPAAHVEPDVADAALAVAGMTVRYGGGAAAVRGIDVNVPAGKVVTIIGPNGAGKTSALRAIAGPIAGTTMQVSASMIQFDGRDLRGLGPDRIARLGIAFVPERDKIFRALTIGDHLRLRSVGDRAERQRREQEVFDLFPRLRDLGVRRQAGTLSGGERQMLALALALSGRPRMLLIDEATLGLAPVAIDDLIVALRRLNTELGVTILMAEQNARLAIEVSDQILAIAGGRIVDSGPPETWSLDRLREAYLGRTAPHPQAAPA